MNSSKSLVRIGVMAGIYCALTLALAPISFGPLQIRVSESLVCLSGLIPQAGIGISLGCFIANLIGGSGFLDVVFGTLATVIGVYFTAKIKKTAWIPVPNILANTLIVPIVLYFSAGVPYLLTALQVFIGESVACYALGLPLYLVFKKHKKDIFRFD